MIATYLNPDEVIKERDKIIAQGKKPVLYTAPYNLCKMIPFPGILDNDEFTEEVMGEDEGYAGRYLGCSVYITRTVGNLWVIVPQYEEK